MRTRILAAMSAVALLMTVAACGSDTSSSSPSALASSQAAQPEAEETPTVIRSLDGLPTVDTTSGTPTFTYPSDTAPEGLQSGAVEAGNGREVADTDFLVVRYIGYVWGKNEAFDSSYSRGASAAFSLDQVVKGWKYALAGQHVGDKVVLSIPPQWGYGEQGQTAAGISGTDTMVFYVEILDAFNQESAGQDDATVETSPDQLPVSYTGELGAPITEISVKEGQSEPTATTVTVIARGTGTPAAASSSLLISYAATTWDNVSNENLWTGQSISRGKVRGPVAATLGQGSVFDSLVGIPAGSRVLLTSAPSTSSSAPAMAVIVDILGVL